MGQFAYQAITSINELIEKKNPHSYCFFYETPSSPCIKPLTATYNISNIWGYTGLLITTSLYNTSLVMNAGCEARKIFYVTDLEWLRPSGQNYLWNLSVYRHPSIELVSRSEEHRKTLSKYCNRKINNVVEDFDINRFVELYSSKSNILDSRRLRFGV